MVKIDHERIGARLVVRLRGDIAGGDCDCLAHFWQRHGGQDVKVIEIDMTEIESIDSVGIATVVDLMRRTPGARQTILGAPQMLAHTLYKRGLLLPGHFELVNPRVEEPYAS